MFRRPDPPPPALLGVADLEPPPPRTPLVSGRNVLRAFGLLGAGVAWGAAVRLADSLPVDAVFIGLGLKVVVGIVFVLAIVLALLFRGFEVDRVAIAAACAIGGAAIGLGAGPTVAPGASVEGSFTFAPTLPAGAPTTAGSLECRWANGRWKIAELRTTALAGLPTPHILSVDFLRKQMSLADGGGSNLLAIGSAIFESPPGTAPRGDGDRSGALDVLVLQVDPASTPADPNEVRGHFTWDCPGPPAD